jgi:hypothetical protein
MIDQNFERIVCWQDHRISQVINTEAVAVDRESFLASHAPFKRIRYSQVSRQIPDTSEDAFLAELTRQAAADQHVFAVILGIPGTGKSHLIRWLKEKYSQNNFNDVILLVEKAKSSLLGTLRQIIESGVFDPNIMRDELERLKGAANELSSNALGDSILNYLQIATHEVVLPADKNPPKKISRNVENFLLDPNVRKWLKRDKGPIDRIKRHISSGKQVGLDEDELPGFIPEDFDVPVELLNSIRDDGGHINARQLADLLNDEEERELRKTLADYLNNLLNFAIGHTTALSTDDLKQIFYQLRRNLRKQGKNLVLLIEDITAFTGIDAGLIDVLATQHTGEENRDYCRIISVVGITDSYFWDRFPDNLRDRITHLLTLNKEIDSTSSESDFLQTPDAAADLVARYLNAMRVDSMELKKWANADGNLESIPNPCYECVFREVCHKAFGSISLIDNPENERTTVGLYPFNKNAIWQMYQGISAANVARTPRSLLRSVVQYVLQSHGPKIKAGRFPPQRNEVGSQFKPPLLREPAQIQIIQEQGKHDAHRLESLLLFWGDRTVNVSSINGETWVGNLPPAVFRAFSIPVIQGQFDGDKPLPPEQPTPIPPPPVVPSTDDTSRYIEDLRNWLDGERLNQYEDYARWLANQIEAFYDWEYYAISRTQVKERIKVAKLVFEGQFGRITSPKSHILFARNQDTFLVLNALVDLNKRLERLGADFIGAHTTTLSTWLRQQETRIIEFVQRPTSVTVPVDLGEITLIENLCFAVLNGEISVDISSAKELYLDLIRASRSNNRWSDQDNRVRGSRSPGWLNLIRRIPADEVKACRDQWLQHINLPQGASIDVRFVDAAKALDWIEKAWKNRWGFLREQLPNNTDYVLWDRFSLIYGDLQIYFQKVVEEEQSELLSLLKQLNEIMGNEEPEKVFREISSLFSSLRDHAIGYSFFERQDLTAVQLQGIKEYLTKVGAEVNYPDKVFALSAGQQSIKNLRVYLQYFNDMVKQAKEIEQLLSRELKDLKVIEFNDRLIQQIEKDYEDIERILLETIELTKEGDRAR